MEGKYLITTDNWFFGPDGFQYRAVWGEVKIIEDSILGIKTNARSSNWYAKVGTEENHVIVAGCQIHYAVKTETKPKQVQTEINVTDEVPKIEKRENTIYIAE
jgi:hypothetical protein